MKNNLKSGIYRWTNVHNGKVYIGEDKTIIDKTRYKNFIKFNLPYSGDYINRAREKYCHIEDWKYEVLEYCTPEERFDLEKYWIAWHKENGYELYNLTNGGEGFDSDYWTDERRKIQSERLKKVCSDEEYKKRMVERSKRAWENDDYRENQVRKGKEKWENDDYRENITRQIKERMNKPEILAKCSKLAKERWNDDEYREHMLTVYSSDEYKKKRSKISREFWDNEDNRKRETEKIKIRNNREETRKKNSEAKKRYWSKEDNRKNFSGKMKEVYSNEELIQKQREIQKVICNTEEWKTKAMLSHKNRIIVQHLDENMKIIGEYPSLRDAGRNSDISWVNIRRHTISGTPCNDGTYWRVKKVG